MFFQPGQEWTSSYYLGAFTLALAACGVSRKPRSRETALVCLAVFGLIMALGNAALLFKLFSETVRPLSFMRFPVKFVVLAIFCLPLLAAMGLTRLDREYGASSSKRSRALLFVSIVLALCMVGAVGVAKVRPMPGEAWPGLALNGLLRIAFLIACVVMFRIRQCSAPGQSRRAWAAWGLILLIGADLLTQAPRLNPSVSSDAMAPKILGEQFPALQSAADGRAFMSRPLHDMLYASMLEDPMPDYLRRRMGLFGNCNLLESIATPDGFYSLYLDEPRAVLSTLFLAPSDAFPEPLADFAAIRYMPTPGQLLTWIERSSAMPLITAGQRPVFVPSPETLKHIARAEFRPRSNVYFAEASRAAIPDTSQVSAEVSDIRFEAERIACTVTSASETLCVVAVAHYPAWRATVNGMKARVHKANHAFMAIEVPAGESQVELRYVDKGFLYGGGISLAGWLALCGVGLRRRRRS